MNVWTAVTISAMVAGTSASETPPAPQDKVRVCLSVGSNPQIFRAEETASQIFARIGLKLDWHRDSRSCAPPNRGIVVTLSDQTDPGFHPGSLAYAFPYEQVTIVVFYDRVKAARVPPLMGYVLVHEITHILEGASDHAKEGIMKSRWDESDYAEMRRERLTFTDRDVMLIHNGLKTQSARRFH
jgi:hypothetical protein